MSEASAVGEPTQEQRENGSTGGGGTSSTEPAHPKPPTPLESEPKRQRSDLALRLGTAFVLVPTVSYVIVAGGALFLFVATGMALVAQREFYGLIEDKGARPLTGLGMGFGAAVMAVAWFGTEYHAMLLMTASLLTLMVAQLRKSEITEALGSISGTFFGVFYVAWLFSHAILLRRFEEAAVTTVDLVDLVTLEIVPGCGVFFLFYCLTTVVCCDAGAYFAGRAFGRHRLAPEISPNKSVEGALGGILTGTLAGLLAKLIFDAFWPEYSAFLPYPVLILFGIVLCVVGIIGDLVESLLKRDADVKDTGALLPGMGGLLDRIDAPLLAMPVMYYMLVGYVWVRAG